MEILTLILIVLNIAILSLFVYNIFYIHKIVKNVEEVINSPDLKKIEDGANILQNANLPQLSKDLSSATSSLGNINSKVNSICSKTIAGQHLC